MTAAAAAPHRRPRHSRQAGQSQRKQQSLNGRARARGKSRCKAIVGRAELAAGDRLQIMAQWSRGGPSKPTRVVAQPPVFSSPLKQAERSNLESENALQTKISNSPLQFSPAHGTFSDSLKWGRRGAVQDRRGKCIAVAWGPRCGRVAASPGATRRGIA